MPDITQLIMDDHATFRARFAELDELQAQGASAERLLGLWEPLASLLERHASAEETLFYPRLLRQGDDGEDETEDALSDHNEIREGIARAAAAEAGSDEWWEAVGHARSENSDHIAEEEREALPDARQNISVADREELGAQWLRYGEEHAGGAGLSGDQKDVQGYIDAHS